MRIHQDTQVVASHFDLQKQFPNVSLPREPQDLPELGYFFVHDTYFPEAGWGQSVVTGAPELVEGQWRYSKVVENTSLETLRKEVQDAVTAKRKEVMAGGITMPDDSIIGTDDTDQARVTSVVANAQYVGLSDEDTVDFKATSGFVTITVAEVKAVAGVIGRFVQGCFTAERNHYNAVALLETREELENYLNVSLKSGWPEGAMGA